MDSGKSVFVFDLNESPPPVVSPGERNGGLRVCGSCRKLAGEVEGEMLVCRCGKCFHMKCMGSKENPDGNWRCFGCLISGNNAGASGSGSSSNAERGRGSGAERMLDMNAPPPVEEEEVQFLGARRAGEASFGSHFQREQYDRRYIITIWM